MVGKQVLTTAMLMTFAIEDILDGQSVVWVGSDSSSRLLLQYVPGDRVNDVIFFSPGSQEDADTQLPGTRRKTRRPMSATKWQKR